MPCDIPSIWMDRRRVLELVGGVSVGVAGCLSRSSGSNHSSPTSPSDSLTAATTPGVEPQVTGPTCPKKPDSMTGETALQFATQFEKAYVTWNVIREHERVISVDIDVGGGPIGKTATQTADGWLARFTVQGPAYRYRPDPRSTQTAHVDPPMYAVNYLITDQSVWRARATEAVAPRETGTEVTCPPL